MTDVTIYEVGPRDGLQNIAVNTPTDDKICMIQRLHYAGLKNMEITSFVHPKLVPNMSDAEDVFTATKAIDDFSVLVPNQKGLDRAKAVGAKKFNVFFSPIETFNKANLGTDMDTSIDNISTMLHDTDRENVRAYISCAFGTTTERVNEHRLLWAMQAADNFADTVVLCDTVGIAHPSSMVRTLELSKHIDANIALHLHHTKNKRDNMFPNIQAALDWGITEFDASIGGLGGCPFMKGSGSNLSTNDMVKYLHKNNYETGLEIWELNAIANSYAEEQIVPFTPMRLRVRNKLQEIINKSPMGSKW